ncbi:HNH endonuclease [Microlunatus sagamiharensis]|uniref:HNH endonuclease n=2 Tax=Microlunatus sagamiharensis TaxID=546874 RepID=A0A1H2LL78_9ACTN|nr:HNH endonuclease [Microlunatus sagamiharensis]
MSVGFRSVLHMDDGAGLVEATPVELALAAHEASFDHLLKLVGDGGLGDHDDLGLVAVLQRVERLRNRHALLDHALVAEGEARRLPETLTQRSMAGVLTSALRLSRGEAARRVRAAEQLGSRRSVTGEPLAPLRPALAAAQEAGDASPEQVDVCLRALATVDHRGFDPVEVSAAEELLAGFVVAFAPKPLADLARQVVERVDPDGTLPADEVDAERRHLTLRTARDGMCVGEFRLTPTLGAKLKAVLSPLAAPRNSVVGEVDGRSVTEVDPRHHGQRLHDALENVCDRLLRSGTLPDSGGTPTSVIVTVGLDELQQRTGTGVTSDGNRLSAAAVADLVEQSVVHPVVVEAKGVVLSMGRTSRLATPGQTMALIARDGGCSFPGCEHPPEWCERHHVVAWVDGGRTDLDNLTLLCRYHHRQFLARGWTCRMIERLPTWTPPRWVDPQQRPLRNTRITTRHLVC